MSIKVGTPVHTKLNPDRYGIIRKIHHCSDGTTLYDVIWGGKESGMWVYHREDIVPVVETVISSLTDRILDGDVWVKDKLSGHLTKVTEVIEEEDKIIICLER